MVNFNINFIMTNISLTSVVIVLYDKIATLWIRVVIFGIVPGFALADPTFACTDFPE